MTRTRAWTISRATHLIAWWVFVVATLFAGGITWLGGRHGYGPLVPDKGGVTYHGSYEPLTGVDMTQAYETSLDISEAVVSPENNVPAALSLAAFIVVMITAAIQAIVYRRLVIGIVAVAVPLVAAGVIALALSSGSWGVELDNTSTMVVVLVGVAIHQSWMFITRNSRPAT